MLNFKQAERTKAKAKVLISGISGSGKTTSALLLARGLCDTPQQVFLLDTENRGNYNANIFGSDGAYMIADMPKPYTAAVFKAAIDECIRAGAKVVIVDGITPFWAGDGGILDKKDSFGASFESWNKVAPDWRMN